MERLEPRTLRACKGCGRLLTGRQETWCEPNCRQRWKKREITRKYNEQRQHLEETYVPPPIPDGLPVIPEGIDWRTSEGKRLRAKRDEVVIAMRRAGHTFTAIGEALKMGAGTAKEVVWATDTPLALMRASIPLQGDHVPKRVIAEKRLQSERERRQRVDEARAEYRRLRKEGKPMPHRLRPFKPPILSLVRKEELALLEADQAKDERIRRAPSWMRSLDEMLFGADARESLVDQLVDETYYSELFELEKMMRENGGEHFIGRRRVGRLGRVIAVAA